MAKEETGSTRGRAVIIQVNGKDVKRADFIRDAYYKKGTSRSDIVKALKELGHEVPYQIVFAATKEGEKGNANTDPRIAAEAKKVEKAAAKAKADAAKKTEADAKTKSDAGAKSA